MKHCPECNFSFPDFHRVCDFDGAELVQSPERKPLVSANKSSRTSRFQRGMKSPVVWAGLLLIGVLASAFLVAYYDASGRSAQILASAEDPPASTTPLQASDRQAEVKLPVTAGRTPIKSNGLTRTSSATVRRPTTWRGSMARLDQKRNRVQPRTSETARRGETQRNSPGKQSKLTAVLKTTWRVVKWPFNF